MQRPGILAMVATAAALTLATLRGDDPVPGTNASLDATLSVSLGTLVAEALEKNPELRFYAAELEAAKAGRKTAGLRQNPELETSVGHKRQSGGGFASEGVAWTASVLQPFEWPGRMSLRKAIANQDIELARLGQERFKAALGGRVRTLAFGLFAAQAKAEAAGEVAGRFRALKEVLVQREPAGLTPLLETRVIEATELNAQRRATESALAAAEALAELNQLRGAPSGARLAISAPSLVFQAPPADPSALLAAARTNNFELRARAAELALQGFRVDLSRNERLPAIRVGPTYSEEAIGGGGERIIGLSLSVPLPLWNRNQGAVEAAVARQAQAEASLVVMLRDVERRVVQAALAYETKVREMSKWRADAPQHFKEAAELADRHYRLGAVPISTYVELQKQYLDAVEGLLDTRKEALEAASQLEMLTGLSVAPAEGKPVEGRP